MTVLQMEVEVTGDSELLLELPAPRAARPGHESE